MGSKGSSSKTRSSKKKRNKISSKVSKKKSRRKESKILHSPDSDSDSASLNSISSSSTSEPDSRIRKNKSKKPRQDASVSSYPDRSMTSPSDSMSKHDDNKHKRRGAKLQRRRRRARKRNGSPDSKVESRKRKRSSRLHVKSRNKLLRKKSRKHFTSSSSDWESSYTCGSGSSSDTEDGKHRRDKSKRVEEVKRSRGKESRRDHKKRKVRSFSSSSCSRCRDHDISVDRSDEALVSVDHSRRLKSVITVVHHPSEERENRWEKDPHKEEIVCDHDDYPSPKSIDSNEEGDRKETDDQSCGASSKKIHVENEENEVLLPVKSGNIGKEGHNDGDSWSLEARTSNSLNEKETHASVNFSTLDGDKIGDGAVEGLELILRQKALENLRRFKGEFQAARKSINLDIDDENVKESSITRNDDVENKPTEPNNFLSQETDKRSIPALPEAKKGSDGEQTATQPPNAPTVFAVSDTNQNSAEHSMKEEQNVAKTGSEFAQKTMSVMRGGEMVQVSYKVYIPKRAPALARRQLRR